MFVRKCTMFEQNLTLPVSGKLESFNPANQTISVLKAEF